MRRARFGLRLGHSGWNWNWDWGRVAGGLAAACLMSGGCAQYAIPPDSSPVYNPDRRDYATFREAHPGLLEPNYLPFMLHRFREDPVRGDVLVVCRWEAGDMPLPVHIERPGIPDEIQDEFHPVDPQIYVERVAHALQTWEGELEALVRFRLVATPDEARLVLRLRGELAPRPSEDVQVLGTTSALLEACRSRGVDPDAERLRVSFAVPELLIYVADRSGLLTPNQVEQIALHEIGHALGMMGHSPISTDFMYRVIPDRPGISQLSIEDVNSFLNLYQLPNGTRFAHVPPGGSPPPPPPGPPSGSPMLSVGPHVDARIGFEVKTPSGWIRVETDHGLFAANGPVWDRDASFQIVVWPYPTIEQFLTRFSQALFADTWLRHRTPVVVNGRRALQVAVEDPSGQLAEEFTIVELGDGRVMMIHTQSPVETQDQWRPWFQASLATLEIWPSAGR
ncbi:MAG: matrixin family metalloprotease [Proteobacteria bacterium]|nr:matrixin family metalloprotease [Pseudomonadota bacterium]